jgi:hypothetical protein
VAKSKTLSQKFEEHEKLCTQNNIATSASLKDIEDRQTRIEDQLTRMNKTLDDLVKVRTVGAAAVRTLLWIGAFCASLSAFVLTLIHIIKGLK